MAGRVTAWLRKLKQGEHTSFGFPAAVAELTPDVVDDLRMRRTLLRFAKTLACQLHKRDKSVIAVEIKGISFICRYVKTDK